MDDRRVLVTGASGFVGGHLARRLAAAGYEVTSIDQAPPRTPLGEGVRTIEQDIRDADALRRSVLDVRPALVFHLAAQASVAVSMREPALDVETNVTATIHLAQAAAEAGARRFVFASTGGAMYGAPPPEALPAGEGTPVEPLSIYGVSKAAAEQYLHVVSVQTGMEVAVLRPANIYGPAQDPHGEAGVVAIFAQRMLRGEPVTIFGDGSQTRDYVYVDDTVEAFLRAADAAEPRAAVVGTGEETSTRRIFDLLASITGYEAPAVVAPERPGDIARISLSPRPALEAWGWRPSVSLEDGLERTVEWFREQQGSA
ncbi:MAG: NAD-dependent epimerase/dehydratase family protein [Dehalococcoidia bacterium]|nr:NAD-dependent epimerase/dehydratase family protein [Dehalococcoidia bacterium]